MIYRQPARLEFSQLERPYCSQARSRGRAVSAVGGGQSGAVCLSQKLLSFFPWLSAEESAFSYPKYLHPAGFAGGLAFRTWERERPPN